jgi:hypothetical protein
MERNKLTGSGMIGDTPSETLANTIPIVYNIMSSTRLEVTTTDTFNAA